jgi:hypothetical protein
MGGLSGIAMNVLNNAAGVSNSLMPQWQHMQDVAKKSNDKPLMDILNQPQREYYPAQQQQAKLNIMYPRAGNANIPKRLNPEEQQNNNM